MRKIMFFSIVLFSLISVLRCNAQLLISKNLENDKVRFDNNSKTIYFGKQPVLSLSLSDLVIEDSIGIIKFDNWNDLRQGKIKVQLKISEYAENIYHLGINLQTDASVALKDMFVQFDFVPQNPSLWSKSRHDFHWIPNIKSKPSHIASDHVFRSPVVMMMSETIGTALIPDLDLLNENRPAPYYLDMRFPENEAPKIIYGLTNSKADSHVYYVKRGDSFSVEGGKLSFGFYLIVNQNISRNSLLREVNNLLWKEFGKDYIVQMEPQTVQFKQYAEYGFRMALDSLWINAGYPNSGGITLSTYYNKINKKWGGRTYPNDLWFHSWFNNMRTAYGLYLWGDKSSRPEWKQKALEVKNLILNSPVEKGFFKTIYNFQTNTWVASGQGGGENVYHLPDNAWTAYWLMRFNQECESDKRITTLTVNFANALLSIQHPDGSFPTRVFVGNLETDPVLDGSASEGLAIWYLAEMRLRNLIPENSKKAVDEAIQKGLDHIRREILPRQKFEDFELYFSCSRKPLNFYDSISEMYGQNTLSIQWCAEAFRTGYQLFKRQQDFKNALYCIDLLCLYQQVWNPSYLSFYAFGGFGVMNTDAEWNDARQAQFAETLANFYDLTGKIEYLERAVAAARASFALMVIDENKDVAPINYKGTSRNFEIHGAMAENYGHCGSDCRSGQSGFHWGTGSALCTSIILQEKYGDLFINPKLNHALGINGIVVNSADFKKKKINLTINRIENYENEYVGKILTTDKSGFPHLKINNKDIILSNQNHFKINK
ncbi:MAG TPA: hypothetical protein VMV77_16915 [Bacteroidales bacterium]|nr:hypothetical protein [Bacteroidales bacterium]